MNLINEPWIPIRRKSGKHELISPWQLTETDDPVIELDAPRPDFNGALMQFLIGLLQTTAKPKDQDKWLDWLEQPQAPEELKGCFAQYADAFELQNENGSFMQDFDSLESALNDVSELLVDSPGGNTIKENKDHFVKRSRVEKMCPSCAATALYCLQTNAPSGGQGHRTSLRGGGPLTTLVIVDDKALSGIKDDEALPNDLWRNLWLNVLDQPTLDTLTGDKEKSGQSDIFPWLAKTRTSEKNTGTETTPLDVNPLQMHWGMPRRIRLDWDSVDTGCCDICDVQSDQLVSGYRAKNYGINYTGAWQHPLSPHSLSKTGDLLPQHAQPGGMTYQHWLGLIDDTDHQFSAAVVKRYRKLAENWGEQFRLFTFGYDMDNMKARCWYETTFPLFTIPEPIRLNFAKRVNVMTETATEFSGFLRSCVKEAWFKRPADAKGDTSFLTKSFFQHTEPRFYYLARKLQDKLPDGSEKEVLHEWHNSLRKSALTLFDYWAARGDIAQVNPRRVAEARQKLWRLAYSKKVREALELPNITRQEAA
jgi:CRISPR system Cascade subunit CasA